MIVLHESKETFDSLCLEQTHGIEITGNVLNDCRLISCLAVCLMLAIALIGTEWESKAQMVLLAILLGAMGDFILGCLIPPTDEQFVKGYVGWSGTILKENFAPDFRKQEDFFSVFAVFFPAATGILAGANISGDLKDPQHSIPLGTLLSIAITTFSYMLFAFLSGALVLRDANGAFPVPNSTFLEKVNEISDCSASPCLYGSHNFAQVIEMVSWFGPLIYAGIFAASLSSALASLVSAPKVFQALCKDRLFPYITFFGYGYGKNNEPRRGYILAFIIAVCCCLIGDLNLIAPIISNFFLAAYCLINFSCFHASFAKSLGFRPSFRYYNMWCSLAGAILCMVVMFVTNWSSALITFVLIGSLYIWVLYRKPDVNWGSSTQAQTYRSAIQSAYKLSYLPDHVKNYRPQVLVLSGNPADRPPLVDFAYGMTRGLGLLICGHAVQGPISQRSRTAMTHSANDWLLRRKVKGFYGLVAEESFTSSIRAMIQCIGIGKLRPNIVLLGYKNNWQTCPLIELQDYFSVIHETFDKHLALAILRIPGSGLDFSKYGMVSDIAACFEHKGRSFLNNSFVSVEVLSKSESDRSTSNLRNESRNTNNDDSDNSSRESSPTPRMARRAHSQGVYAADNGGPKEIPKEILTAVNQFQRKQKKGTIDVWWLYDDGGLTMLLPFILSTRSQWSGCRMRVFALANKKDQLDREQRNMAALLNKFRIDYSDVTVIPDVVRKPRRETKEKFQELVSKFLVSDEDHSALLEATNNEGDGDSFRDNNTNDGSSSNKTDQKQGVITETEMVALKDKVSETFTVLFLFASLTHCSFEFFRSIDTSGYMNF